MRENGEITIVEPGSDRVVQRIPTLQCVHCGCHWQCSPGSGKVRGFCMNCNGPVCGPGCAECVSRDQMIDNIEHGRDPKFKPVMSSLSGAKMWLPGV